MVILFSFEMEFRRGDFLVRNILGSLSFALSASRASDRLIARLTPLLTEATREIECLMNDEPEGQNPARVSPARLRVAR